MIRAVILRDRHGTATQYNYHAGDEPLMRRLAAAISDRAGEITWLGQVNYPAAMVARLRPAMVRQVETQREQRDRAGGAP